ncbi:ammonium transporter [Antrihabitans cavernicola]|uniref:Ammonium transporter n=1 Tax=Antrihabitans cavernicola TaxID=2495913 RepID=A0A5A7S7F9_9NOCA|nr:ammonium transporter [Spelaeibacter cavernicola]KAA0018931.1 ammonium transporter [Spelaeibacter cavernicola]
MNIRRLTATAVLVIAAMGVGMGTSAAAPAAPTDKGVGYEAKLVDKTVVTTLDGGFFQVSSDGKTVDVKDKASGNALVTLPLAFNFNNATFPLVNKVSNDGKVLETTPDLLHGKPLLRPVASTIENQAAMSAFATQLGIATAIGGLTGTAIGAVVGGIIGSAGLLGGPVGLATILGGIATGAGVGGVIGTIVAGGPTLLIAGVDLVSTLTAPPGTSKYADQLPK